MSVTAILAPVFVQIALIFALLLWMGSARIALIRAGEVSAQDVALGERNWPAASCRSGTPFTTSSSCRCSSSPSWPSP